MKNNIFYLLILLLVTAGLSSCDEDTTAGYTDITYYPTLEVLSTDTIVNKGADYVDPGVYAELQGEDVTDQVQVTSNVDLSEAGIYTISYDITNDDGFTVSKSRTVYVADPTPSVISSGMHTVQEGTHRIWFSSGARVDFNGYDIIILQTEPGVFYISDFMGGYYDKRAGYGSGYAMQGYFELNEDNTITPISSLVPSWGDSMDEMTSSSVDPVTGQISYVMEYAGLMEYNIIMN